MSTPEQPKEPRKRTRPAARKPALERALGLVATEAQRATPPGRVKPARIRPKPVQPVATPAPFDPDSESAIFGSEPVEPVYVQPQPDRLPGVLGAMQTPVPVDIGAKARHVRLYSPKYAREFIYAALRPMLLAGVTHDIIAQKFGCSTKTISRWKKEIIDQLRDECANMSPVEAFAESMNVYTVMRQQAMATLSLAKTVAERCAAMNTQRSIEADINRLRQLGGMFDNPFLGKGASTRDKAEQQADMLKGMATDFLSLTSTIRARLGDTVGTVDGLDDMTLYDTAMGAGAGIGLTLDVEASDAAQ